jgi:dimethylamine/trimethylamine dehydrogenase
LTPDDLMAGAAVSGSVVVYDEDHYYMGGVLAEKLARMGCAVTIVTSAPEISAFGINTLELPRIARRLDELGVKMLTHHRLSRIEGGGLLLSHIHTGREQQLPADAVVMVTSRTSNDALYTALQETILKQSGDSTLVSRIGDCLAPGAIYHAVYAGHRFAQEFDGLIADMPFRRERISLGEID